MMHLQLAHPRPLQITGLQVLDTHYRARPIKKICAFQYSFNKNDIKKYKSFMSQ